MSVSTKRYTPRTKLWQIDCLPSRVQLVQEGFSREHFSFRTRQPSQEGSWASTPLFPASPDSIDSVSCIGAFAYGTEEIRRCSQLTGEQRGLPQDSSGERVSILASDRTRADRVLDLRDTAYTTWKLRHETRFHIQLVGAKRSAASIDAMLKQRSSQYCRALERSSRLTPHDQIKGRAYEARVTTPESWE